GETRRRSELARRNGSLREMGEGIEAGARHRRGAGGGRARAPREGKATGRGRAGRSHHLGRDRRGRRVGRHQRLADQRRRGNRHMKVKAVIDAAARLRQAEESGTPCANLRDLFDAEDIAAAYAVQTANRDHWLKAGRRPVGRKIALSAKGAQAMFRTTEPAYGMLYADMLLGDGDEVAKGRVLQPRLEGEVAMVLDRDLDMEEPTLVDVLRAVGYCLPAIEIVGCRIASLDTKLVDLVADNAGGG